MFARLSNQSEISISESAPDSRFSLQKRVRLRNQPLRIGIWAQFHMRSDCSLSVFDEDYDSEMDSIHNPTDWSETNQKLTRTLSGVFTVVSIESHGPWLMDLESNQLPKHQSNIDLGPSRLSRFLSQFTVTVNCSWIAKLPSSDVQHKGEGERSRRKDSRRQATPFELFSKAEKSVLTLRLEVSWI